ncbi:MAG: glycoside hydrolase family 2 protein, partial [Eubacteriales bacterium]
MLNKQPLNDLWYAREEEQDCFDVTPYTSRFDAEACTQTSIPALVKDLFPLSDMPIWFYKTFRTELSADAYHRIFICFDQVICLCDVWINGIHIGKHIHSEEKFAFDITDALCSGDNLLACRVYGPVMDKTGPDGIAMDTVPNFAQIYSYYTVIPKTGIYGTVSLQKKPLCEIKDLYVNPDPKTQSVSLELTLQNCRNLQDTAEIVYQIYEGDMLILSAQTSLNVDAGETAVSSVDIPMNNMHLWSPDDPYLYDLHVLVRTGCGEDFRQKRFGFKSFCVEDGWFVLNGKRIWLSCAHTIEGKEAVIHAKTMGFKALRFLSAMPSEDILDLCDEIGILVYEECAVSWGMLDYPDMPAHMSAYLDNMIRRDRSHVSVSIWGIFNEQAGPNDRKRSGKTPHTTEVFDFAVSYLQKMRQLDNTRLILLSSGRWDARADIGSFSNP